MYSRTLCPTQEVRRSIDGQESISQVSTCVKQDEALCNNKLVVVDHRHLIDYGMVMMQVVWLIGDSLDYVKLNHRKDILLWVLNDDKIINELKSVPERKNNNSKKKKPSKTSSIINMVEIDEINNFLDVTISMQ
ncbi:hypothetical protein Glove_99g108 [Diversispora epigaea]|uniref:Uncharacterized protein n=1 Tax=Diversispora epigaea TaxID=1348612 RepID=A0A397JES9_9GLOM|nr:hypothetical protein Glove_99g108 [Diversispora epigaea]